MSDGELTEDDAMAMLEFHSDIHRARSVGSSGVAFATGILAGHILPGNFIPGSDLPIIFGAAVCALVGLATAILVPRAMMGAIENPEERDLP